jgi:ABC-type multidrug transport system ATPase subunit
MSALLELENVRVEAGNRVLAATLSLSLSGPRAVIVGDASPILAPLFGAGRVVSGRFLIGETELAEAAPRLGLAPHAPALPNDMTPLAFVAWGARLGGRAPREADALAARTCALAGLGDDARARIAKLNAVSRRLVVLAQAAVLAPRVLVAEAPVHGLDPVAGAAVLAALSRLVGPRYALISTPRFEPGTAADALARGADELVLIEGGHVIEQGPPGELVQQAEA